MAERCLPARVWRLLLATSLALGPLMPASAAAEQRLPRGQLVVGGDSPTGETNTAGLYAPEYNGWKTLPFTLSAARARERVSSGVWRRPSP